MPPVQLSFFSELFSKQGIQNIKCCDETECVSDTLNITQIHRTKYKVYKSLAQGVFSEIRFNLSLWLNAATMLYIAHTTKV